MVVQRRLSVRQFHPGDGNTGRARAPLTQKPARIVHAVGVEIGFQQGELDEVELGAAAAEALALAVDRLQGIDRGAEIPPFERGECAGQRGNERAGWLASLTREIVHLPHTLIERGVITPNGLCQHDVQVGERRARAGQRVGGECMHHAPGIAVALVSGQFPTPKKRNRVGHFRARRSTVHVERKGILIEP